VNTRNNTCTDHFTYTSEGRNCLPPNLITVALLIAFRRSYTEISWNMGLLTPSILLGSLLCGMWVLVDRFTPHFSFLGSRVGFEPFAAFHSYVAVICFLTFRFFGLVLVAPVMEELFWRSFVLRLAVNPDSFRQVQIGTYTAASFAAAVVLMAVAHTEWLAAALFSAAMNLIVYRTKSIAACIGTHAATNLWLGIYIIVFHAWRFW
jgi:CAAX prenyl protease-like protein